MLSDSYVPLSQGGLDRPDDLYSPIRDRLTATLPGERAGPAERAAGGQPRGDAVLRRRARDTVQLAGPRRAEVGGGHDGPPKTLP